MQNNWRDVLVKDFSRDAGECRTAEAQLENGTGRYEMGRWLLRQLPAAPTPRILQ